MHEAHCQGIIHRDLKPSNIILDPSGSAKILDFGIARLQDTDMTATRTVMGTPAYISPEQVEGKSVDARSDIYALGFILYEAFTGTSAFIGDTPMAVALKQIREHPRSPRDIDPSLPTTIDAAILRCLEKHPEKRFQSAAEAARAFTLSTSADLKPAGAAANPVTPGEAPPRWRFQRTLPIAVAAVRRSAFS